MKFDFYVRTKEDLVEAVETFGIVPYFSNSISGFSLEEHCDPNALWSDTQDCSWDWKGPVIQETGCAYGKFFDKKAVYVSREWFPDLANYRRDGYDFDARYDDGLAKHQDKELFDLIEQNGPLLSKDLRALGNYAYHSRFGKQPEGKKGFDTTITRLQELCYVVICDFVYTIDKHGLRRGWGVAQYSTPEQWLGQYFTDRVYAREPQESYERLLEHLHKLHPQTSEAALRKFLK